MIRRLFTVLSAVALMLCVMAVAVWMRSKRIEREHVEFAIADGRVWDIAIHSDGIEVLTVAAFPHPRLWNYVVYPHRVESSSFDLYGVMFPHDWNARPLTDSQFLGVTYHAFLDTPAIVHNGVRGQPEANAWLVDDGSTIAEAPRPVPCRWIELPQWLLPLVTGAGAPFVLLRLAQGIRRHRRRRSGRCPQCGYDLRANTGRCPECGTPIAEEAKP